MAERFEEFNRTGRSQRRDELAWQEDALCAETDPEIFFIDKGGSSYDAKKICGQCDVALSCLLHAGLQDLESGTVYGGMTAPERKNLLKKSRSEIEAIFENTQAKNRRR